MLQTGQWTARSAVNWFTCLKASVSKVSVGDLTLGWKPAEHSYRVLPPHFHHGAPWRMSLTNSLVSVSVAHCRSPLMPRALHTSVGLRSSEEQKQQPLQSFSQQHSETQGPETPGSEFPRQPPRWVLVSGSTHCWPLCMLQSAGSSSPAPPSSC